MTLEYAVVFERTPNNYSAYVPDLPGCVTTGQTLEEVEKNIRERSYSILRVSESTESPFPNPVPRQGS